MGRPPARLLGDLGALATPGLVLCAALVGLVEGAGLRRVGAHAYASVGIGHGTLLAVRLRSGALLALLALLLTGAIEPAGRRRSAAEGPARTRLVAEIQEDELRWRPGGRPPPDRLSRARLSAEPPLRPVRAERARRSGLVLRAALAAPLGLGLGLLLPAPLALLGLGVLLGVDISAGLVGHALLLGGSPPAVGLVAHALGSLGGCLAIGLVIARSSR